MIDKHLKWELKKTRVLWYWYFVKQSNSHFNFWEHFHGIMLIQIKPAPLLLLYHRMYHILPDEETSRAACRVKKSQLLLLPSHHEFPFCCRPSACGCFNRSVIVGFGSSFNREKANFFLMEKVREWMWACCGVDELLDPPNVQEVCWNRNQWG